MTNLSDGSDGSDESHAVYKIQLARSTTDRNRQHKQFIRNSALFIISK